MHDISSRILVVADNGAVQAHAGRLVRERGHTVFAVSRIDEARQLLGRHPFDAAIVTTGLLEDGVGVDLVVEARRRGESTRWIFITSSAEPESTSALLHGLGVFRVLGNPIDPTTLLDAVEQALAPISAARRGDDAAPTTPPETPTLHSPRLLVLDSRTAFLDELRSAGRRHLLDVLAATTPQQALAVAAAHPIDAVLMDFSPGPHSCRLLIAALRQATGNDRLPVALLSDHPDMEHRLEAAACEATLFLPRSICGYDLVRAVRQMCPAKRQQPARVLIAAPAANRLVVALGELVGPEHAELHGLEHTGGLVDSLEEVRPDLVLIGQQRREEASAVQILRVIRSDVRWRSLPVLVFGQLSRSGSGRQALQAGADDCLEPGLSIEALALRIRTRLDRIAALRDEAERDGLTGLLSRRALIEATAARLVEAERRGAMLSICLMDLDRLKSINDLHGHLAGDRVLSRLGQLLTSCLRSSDIRGRWGGEEFMVIFPDEDASSAAAILARVHCALRDTGFVGENGRPFSSTLSAGVAAYPIDGQTLEQLIGAADRRLYAAKSQGRDRIQVFDSDDVDDEP